MRKIFSFLAAAAMLFTASCSNDDLGTDNGNEAQVTFNLGLEGQAGTRAIGDGSGVTKLYYYIFDAAGNRLKSYDYTNEAFSTVTPQIKLAKDQTYTAVFWAQKETTAYEVVAAADEKGDVQVKVTYGNANDEARDAFFGKKEFTVTGSERIDVILKRPFAQLNVGVTKEDYNAAVASGVTIAKSWAKVEKVNNTLNLLSGEATGEVDAEFALAVKPAQDLEVNLNNSTDAAGNATIEEDEKFEYLSMNYVLVGNRKNVKASFRFENENGSKKIEFNSGLDAVPVERNFRTNLVGQILTGNLDFNVKIDASFQGNENINKVVNANVKTAQELLAAMADEDINVIVLEGDIQLTESMTRAAATDPTILINKGKELTIDLNGKKLWAESNNTGKNYNMFDVRGTLTIVDGTIECKHLGDNMLWNNSTNLFNVTDGGVLNLNGVTAKNLGGSDMAFVAHLDNWGEVTLNVENCTLEAPYVAVRVFNSGYDMNNVTIKNSTLKGGKFAFWVHNYTIADFGTQEKVDAQKELLNLNIFNPECNNTFVGTTAAIRYGFTNSISANEFGQEIVSEGVIKDAEGNEVATNNTGLNTLIGKGQEEIALAKGEYTMPSVDGKELTIKGDENVVITVVKPNFTGSDLTLQGVTIKGSGYSTGVQHVNTVTYDNAKIVGEMCLYGEKVVFNKCTFELSKGQYIWTYGAKVVEFNECTFNTAGKAILVYNEGAGASNVTVKDCKFYATAGDKAGAIANQNCAAIEIDNFGGKVGNENLPGMAHKVTISGNNQYDDGEKFSGLWRIKNFVAGNPVTVNDVQYTQIAIDGKLMTIDASKNVSVLNQ